MTRQRVYRSYAFGVFDARAACSVRACRGNILVLRIFFVRRALLHFKAKIEKHGNNAVGGNDASDENLARCASPRRSCGKEQRSPRTRDIRHRKTVAEEFGKVGQAGARKA